MAFRKSVFRKGKGERLALTGFQKVKRAVRNTFGRRRRPSPASATVTRSTSVASSSTSVISGRRPDHPPYPDYTRGHLHPGNFVPIMSGGIPPESANYGHRIPIGIASNRALPASPRAPATPADRGSPGVSSCSGRACVDDSGHSNVSPLHNERPRDVQAYSDTSGRSSTSSFHIKKLWEVTESPSPASAAVVRSNPVTSGQESSQLRQVPISPFLRNLIKERLGPRSPVLRKLIKERLGPRELGSSLPSRGDSSQSSQPKTAPNGQSRHSPGGAPPTAPATAPATPAGCRTPANTAVRPGSSFSSRVRAQQAYLAAVALSNGIGQGGHLVGDRVVHELGASSPYPPPPATSPIVGAGTNTPNAFVTDLNSQISSQQAASARSGASAYLSARSGAASVYTDAWSKTASRPATPHPALMNKGVAQPYIGVTGGISNVAGRGWGRALNVANAAEISKMAGNAWKGGRDWGRPRIDRVRGWLQQHRDVRDTDGDYPLPTPLHATGPSAHVRQNGNHPETEEEKSRRLFGEYLASEGFKYDPPSDLVYASRGWSSDDDEEDDPSFITQQPHPKDIRVMSSKVHGGNGGMKARPGPRHPGDYTWVDHWCNVALNCVLPCLTGSRNTTYGFHNILNGDSNFRKYLHLGKDGCRQWNHECQCRCNCGRAMRVYCREPGCRIRYK